MVYYIEYKEKAFEKGNSMTNIKGLTELGFNNNIRKPDVVRAYANDYGVIVDVQETPYGFNAYIDSEGKCYAHDDIFYVIKDTASLDFSHFDTMEELAEYLNQFKCRCRTYYVQENTQYMNSVFDVETNRINELHPYRNVVTTEPIICRDMVYGCEPIKTFKNLIKKPEIATFAELVHTCKLKLKEHEHILYILQEGSFVSIITKIEPHDERMWSTDLDKVLDKIALSSIQSDDSFELVSCDYRWNATTFRYNGFTFVYQQYLDHNFQRIVECVETKEDFFLIDDSVVETLEDGSLVEDDEAYVKICGEYIKKNLKSVLENISHPIACMTYIDRYRNDDTRSRLLFAQDKPFVDELVNLAQNGGECFHALDAFTHTDYDETTNTHIYNVVYCKYGDDVHQYVAKLRLI